MWTVKADRSVNTAWLPKVRDMTKKREIIDFVSFHDKRQRIHGYSITGRLTGLSLREEQAAACLHLRNQVSGRYLLHAIWQEDNFLFH